MDSPRTPGQRVAEAVRAAMAAKGVSQLALAAATGIAQATLSRRLAGSAFDVDELALVADYLGMTSADLLGVAA